MGISKRGLFTMVFLAALAGGMIAVGSYTLFVGEASYQAEYDSIAERQEIALANNSSLASPNKFVIPDGLNFVEAAESSTKGVVHIRGRSESSVAYNGFLRGTPAVSQGSGVIISDDGYIATNNHVVEGADYLQVTLSDNRRYEAKIIGTDPSTDLALIKIKEKNLDFIPYGNSDQVRIGEWVLAVGNPFELNSTVTAGIVSAKARNIQILRQENNLQIESFIQTDAAVNPGNSGGALVDLSGKLVGINTAIATRTGSYAGYSFAVPVTLVKKVMDDLLEFGEVQRALLGIGIADVAQASQYGEYDGELVNGVLVRTVNEGSAAQDAGIKTGDVITKIGSKTVDNVSELQELVAVNRPGDRISVTYDRDGEEHTTMAELKGIENSLGTIVSVESDRNYDIFEGATFEQITESESEDLGIEGGVKVTNVGTGVWENVGIEEGFIITEIDNTPIREVNDIKRALKDKEGERVVVLGLDRYGDKSYLAFRW